MVVRHSPLLRPRTANSRDPITLIPSRGSQLKILFMIGSRPAGPMYRVLAFMMTPFVSIALC
jgi:hypothetical protein